MTCPPVTKGSHHWLYLTNSEDARARSSNDYQSSSSPTRIKPTVRSDGRTSHWLAKGQCRKRGLQEPPQGALAWWSHPPLCQSHTNRGYAKSWSSTCGVVFTRKLDPVPTSMHCAHPWSQWLQVQSLDCDRVLIVMHSLKRHENVYPTLKAARAGNAFDPDARTR